jgi:hypothetical protein
VSIPYRVGKRKETFVTSGMFPKGPSFLSATTSAYEGLSYPADIVNNASVYQEVLHAVTCGLFPTKGQLLIPHLLFPSVMYKVF